MTAQVSHKISNAGIVAAAMVVGIHVRGSLTDEVIGFQRRIKMSLRKIVGAKFGGR